MKAVILAGGLGTRISEETQLKPKPMVEIGGNPILWHIMKIYSSFGINDFIICCGYKGYVIKEYFANYLLHRSDVTFDFKEKTTKIYKNQTEDWSITCVDTGELTATGGRLKRVLKYLKNDDEFCFTYGDGLSNVDINELIKFHRKHNKLATVTTIQPPGRFGSIKLTKDEVVGFKEKPIGDGGWINGGFFVLSPEVINYIQNDDTSWETSPMHDLVKDNQLMAFKHEGFWQPMDTLRDKVHLNQLWKNKIAPWKNW